MLLRSFLLAIVCLSSVFGQTRSSLLVPRSSWQSGALFQYWSTSARDQRLHEFVLPLVFNYAPSERFSLSLLNTPTRAQYDNGGNASRLFGFSDTRLASAWVLGEERGVLNFGVSLPSGPTQLDSETELPVAEKIATHALAMPTSYFGGGWEASLGLALAWEVGSWVLGTSVSGVYHGSFTPIAGSAKYRPGPELSMALGFDRVFGEAHRLFGDVSYTWYGKDESEGQKIFQSDGKLSLSLAGIWSAQPWQISVLLQNHFKRKSPYALNNTRSISYGNEFVLNMEWARTNAASNAWLALVDLRLHAANAEGLGKATIFSFGPGWRGQVSAPLQLQTSTRLALGKLNDSKLWGVEVNLGLTYFISR
jgi:hypothetical protein